MRKFLLHPAVSFHTDGFIFPAHLYFQPLDGALLCSSLLMCEQLTVLQWLFACECMWCMFILTGGRWSGFFFLVEEILCWNNSQCWTLVVFAPHTSLQRVVSVVVLFLWRLTVQRHFTVYMSLLLSKSMSANTWMYSPQRSAGSTSLMKTESSVRKAIKQRLKASLWKCVFQMVFKEETDPVWSAEGACSTALEPEEANGDLAERL